MPKVVTTPGSLNGPDKDSPCRTATGIDTDLQNPTDPTHPLCAPHVGCRTLHLDVLSEELDKRTKETQRLQDQIEIATREAFRKVCCIHSLNPRLSKRGEKDTGLSRVPDPSQPDGSGLDALILEAVWPDFPSSGKEVPEDQVEDCCDPVSELQRKISESRDPCDQQMFHYLQTTQRSAEEKLRQVQEEARVLRGKAESLEATVREVYSTLEARRRGGNPGSGLSAPGGPGQLSSLWRLAVEVLEDLEQERDELQEGLSQALDKLKSEELNHQSNAEAMLKEHQDRMQKLIAGHDQQVVMLTEKLNSNAILLLELERLQKHAESQESLHMCQIKELDSVISIDRDRIAALEQQVDLARAQAEEAQKGREQSLKQAEELQSRLDRLTEELRQARKELGVEKEHSGLLQERSRELQAAGEELRKDPKEGGLHAHHLHSLLGMVQQDGLAQMEALRSRERQARLQLHEEVLTLREQRGAAGERGDEQCLLGTPEQRRAQTLLIQRDQELRLTQQEAQQARAGLEALQRRVEEGKKVVEILVLQLETAGQVTEQSARVAEDLHREKQELGHQLVRLQLELQNLQGCVVEQARRVQDLTLEREQLLGLQRTQKQSLAEAQEVLGRLRAGESEECQGVVRQLRDQLRSTQEELRGVHSTLRILGDTERRALKAARGMQRELTARRQQVDVLQSSVNRLEDAAEMLTQEGRVQAQEREAAVRELASLREHKRQLAEEVESLSSREAQHKGQVLDLKKALRKETESLADCRDVLQRREQECVRLNLQHTLVLKELQAHSRCAAVRPGVPPPPAAAPLASSPTPAGPHPPRGHAPPVMLRCVMSDTPRRPPTEGRGSAPGGGCRTTRHSSSDTPQEEGGPAQLNPHSERPLPGRLDLREGSTDRSDTPFLCRNIPARTFPDLLGSPSSTPTSSSLSPPAAVCRSPVHSLLTSDPRHKPTRGHHLLQQAQRREL